MLAHLAKIRETLSLYTPDRIGSALVKVDAKCLEILGLHEASVTVLVSVLAIVVVTLLFSCISSITGGRAGRKTGKTCLLTGPCGAGKTLMLHMLCRERPVTTVTSIVPASLPFKVGGSSTVKIIDYPGHGRLWAGLQEEASKARAVIFVLDGAEIQEQIRLVAESLYDTLAVRGSKYSNMLVAVNKSDLKEQRLEKVESALVKELKRVQFTRTMLDTQGDDGRRGGDVQLEPTPFKIVACSAKEGLLEPVRGFIESCFS